MTVEAGTGTGRRDGGGAGEGWETVIGLEVHCELLTATKLFCGCINAFGDEPNTNICPVCLGLPGSLPVLNAQAVDMAMRIGLALHCEVRPSSFARKNYFYPDMPKDYQISQYDEPIDVGGWLDLPDGWRVGIVRAHLEEDTGKTSHLGADGRIHASDYSLVDYNRSGVPLVEIVSEPDMRSAAQARAYVSELRAVLMATGASDGRMEEGSLRVDANVSVRPLGSDTLGTRCEIKNLNSLRSLGRAIEYEAARQVALIDGGEAVAQETRHWDEAAGRTTTMRSKEEAYDYRYFPEPDLVPLAPDPAWQRQVAAGLGPMPAERRAALVALLGASPSPAQLDQVLAVVAQGLDPFVTAGAGGPVPAGLALARAANELAADAEAGRRLDPASWRALLELEASGALSATQAKAVLVDLVAAGGGDPSALAAARGYEAMAEGSLATVVGEVVAANPDEWQRFVGGEDKLSGFFIGKVMDATDKKANGKEVVAELRRLRDGSGR
ncbi:MAG TPA: Asp-tRNA(Asn)/Glu-tRNA(Gln) amidotransferase subunit GatB [Acidimicrobiales bacterium]|nr:Asp-tRNA(Asn)/Glu-tRNA(Gln) amidotransferase subunit GatB [Acidimicrobiales bacterium]